MSRTVVSTTATRPLDEVRATLRRRRIRQLPVVAGAKVVGIVTDRDLRSAGPRAKVAGDVMHRQVLLAEPSMSVDEAARILSQHKINALPVVERDRIAGIITSSDILAAFVDLSGVAEPTYRVSLEATERRLGLREIRRIVDQHRGELKWSHTERRTRPARIHIRLKARRVDDIVTALESAGFTVCAVVASRPAGRART
jgi:acetoin utilization protein AcuB